MQSKFLYAAYGWLLVSGFLHYGVDVVSQHVRGKRTPGAETTLYYGLNTAYALGQVLVASVALFAIRHGTPMGSWPGLTIGFGAAAAWLWFCFLFIEYPQPKFVPALFAALLVGAAFAPR